MALNNDKQASLKKALLFLQEYKNKPEPEQSDKNKITGVDIVFSSFNPKNYWKELNESDLGDEDLLRTLAEQVLGHIKNHQPQLLSGLKEKYFKDL